MRFTDKELGHTVTVKFDGNFKNAVLWSQCRGLRVYGAVERIPRQPYHPGTRDAGPGQRTERRYEY